MSSLGLPAQERYGPTGEGPAQGHRNGQGAGTQGIQAEVEGAGTVEPEEETAQGEFATVWT